MPGHTFTETHVRSWGSRLMGALVGMILSPLALLAGCGLLIWNEGNVVKRAQSLDEGEKQVITVSADTIDSANLGKLVHVSGQTSVADKLIDKELGISEPAIKLLRVVEMYQWTEKKQTKRQNDRTTTTYTYDKKWTAKIEDSRSFHQTGFENPDFMPVQSHDELADHVALGAFQLSTNLIAQIDKREPRHITPEEFAALPAHLRESGELRGGEIYLPAARWIAHVPQDSLNEKFRPSAEVENENNPQIGDIRIRYTVVRPGPATVVARQTETGFDGFPTKAGKRILEFRAAALSAQEMFEAAREDNTQWAWIPAPDRTINDAGGLDSGSEQPGQRRDVRDFSRWDADSGFAGNCGCLARLSSVVCSGVALGLRSACDRCVVPFSPQTGTGAARKRFGNRQVTARVHCGKLAHDPCDSHRTLYAWPLMLPD
jgi:hypothetical protein